MSRSPWTELGIAPTADGRLIRQAYAVRLRALGGDRDPASFMRLRGAYEMALAAVAVSEGDDDAVDATEGACFTLGEEWHQEYFPERGDADDGPSFASDATARPNADDIAHVPQADVARSWDVPGDLFADFVTVFENALRAGDVATAGAGLKAALAHGSLPIGQEPSYLRAFLAAASETLSSDELDDIERLAGEALSPGRDPDAAMLILRRRAVLGDAAAQEALAKAYALGRRGLPRDGAEASRWRRRAAEQGNAAAQRAIAIAYIHGRDGSPQDEAEGAVWFHRAAEQGDAQAQCWLGFLFEYGRGVIQNYTQAMSWYRKAADQGLPVAQSNVGEMYQYGRGVPRDDGSGGSTVSEGRRPGIRHGAKGSWRALYFYGEGVAANLVAAYGWLSLALEHGRGCRARPSACRGPDVGGGTS